MIWFVIIKALLVGLLLGALFMFLSFNNKKQSKNSILGDQASSLMPSSYAQKLQVWLRFLCKVLICIAFLTAALFIVKMILM